MLLVSRDLVLQLMYSLPRARETPISRLTSQEGHQADHKNSESSSPALDRVANRARLHRGGFSAKRIPECCRSRRSHGKCPRDRREEVRRDTLNANEASRIIGETSAMILSAVITKLPAAR